MTDWKKTLQDHIDDAILATDSAFLRDGDFGEVFDNVGQRALGNLDQKIPNYAREYEAWFEDQVEQTIRSHRV